MADFFVDAGSGSDANTGESAASPFRSLTRATEAAARLPVVVSGTIHLADGVYAVPEERFPILVPPGFALEGESRDGTIIRFTGESRTIEGTTTVYFGGVAIKSSDPIRRLTLEGTPVPPGYSCQGTVGILANWFGLALEDVAIRSMTADDRGSFSDAVWSRYGAVCRRPSCERSGPLTISGHTTNNIVEDGSFDEAFVGISGPGVVRNNDFTGLGRVAVGALYAIQVVNNRFASEAFAIAVGWSADSRAPTPGAMAAIMGNRIDARDGWAGIQCDGPARCLIASNDIATAGASVYGLVVDLDADPIVVANRIESRGGGLLRVSRGATPRIESNTFVALGPGPRFGLWIEAEADLGGGPTGSAGRNDFSDFDGGMYASLPGAGGVVYARDNIWRRGMRRIQTTPGTEVDQTGSRLVAGSGS